MTDTLRVKNTVISLVKEDITDIEIDSFVYYAQHDLVLGSGFGTAISVRGGPSVQEELNCWAAFPGRGTRGKTEDHGFERPEKG